MSLEKSIDPDYQIILNDFERNFDYLYDNIDLNMTLKVHVILHHFSQYFDITNSTMRDTNGEFVETLHSSLHIHEENHGYKVVRKLGTQVHLKKAKNSLTSFNSKRAGFSPAHDLTLRKNSRPAHLVLAHLFNKSYVLIYSIVYTFLPCINSFRQNRPPNDKRLSH